MLSGFKTFIVGLTLAVLPQIVAYAGDFDFVKTFGLSPDAATWIGILIVGLRAATSTPIFKAR